MCDPLLPRDFNGDSDFFKSYSQCTYLNVGNLNGPILRSLVNGYARFLLNRKIELLLFCPQLNHKRSGDARLCAPSIGILVCSPIGI